MSRAFRYDDPRPLAAEPLDADAIVAKARALVGMQSSGMTPEEREKLLALARAQEAAKEDRIESVFDAVEAFKARQKAAWEASSKPAQVSAPRGDAATTEEDPLEAFKARNAARKAGA